MLLGVRSRIACAIQQSCTAVVTMVSGHAELLSSLLVVVGRAALCRQQAQGLVQSVRCAELLLWESALMMLRIQEACFLVLCSPATVSSLVVSLSLREAA